MEKLAGKQQSTTVIQLLTNLLQLKPEETSECQPGLTIIFLFCYNLLGEQIYYSDTFISNEMSYIRGRIPSTSLASTRRNIFSERVPQSPAISVEEGDMTDLNLIHNLVKVVPWIIAIPVGKIPPYRGP